MTETLERHIVERLHKISVHLAGLPHNADWTAPNEAAAELEALTATVSAQREEIERLRSERSVAIRDAQRQAALLKDWVDAHPDDQLYQPTMTELQLPNTSGWIWAKEVQEERDFDAEREKQRDLAMQCISDAEERAQNTKFALAASQADVARLREALEPFAGTPTPSDVFGDGDEVVLTTCTIANLRRAREALTAIPEPSRRVERETIG